MRSRFIHWITAGVLAAMFISGAVVFASGAVETGTAAPGAAKIVHVALSGNPDTLDPQATAGTLTFQVDRSIYDTLVEPGPDGRIIGSLASSWDISPDNLTWTFHLRNGVEFQNGDPLTSADVKATLERIVSPAEASPKAGEFKAIKSIETPDAKTVVLKLSEPYAPLLATLASGWSAILPAGLIKSGHDFATQPVGTGPFTFQSMVRDNKIVLVRNGNYWQSGVPKLNGVEFDIISEESVQVQGLLSGQLQVADMIGKKDIPTLEQNPGTTYDKQLTSLVNVLAINNAHSPLDQLPVRQAINYAIDKQKALDVAYDGGNVVGTFMDYSDPYYVDYTNRYPYDPEKARQILASLSTPLTRTLDMALPQNYEPHVTAGQIYQQMLKDVGIKTQIRLVEWSTWLSDVYKGGNYDLTVIGHTGKLDPDGRLSGYGTGNSYVHWKNPEAASLIEKARTVVGFDQRKPLYDQVLKIMAEQVPMVFVGTPYRYVGLSSAVSGFRMDTKLDTYDFRQTDMK